ncbi:YCF48-related protein [Caballeronia sp. Lep1P3]|uniref:WD40/YVTN/BNR-like repeat-containing protein n=1 Tax=Caballeronia sp. Lep1P3 TaxID=2878150 RepID=UPI001FD58F39|nr:YCF48-related protein [Caballeronia sp. Lep1P3]
MVHRKYASLACSGVMVAALATGAWAAGAAGAQAAPFVDPLDASAVLYRNAAERPLMSVSRAGKRLVAVGMRGLIVTSDDEGKTWTQTASPVRSDLLASCFPSAREGWAVGHDGVILHTADGGRTWARQFDGRMAAKALIDDYRARIAAGQTNLQPYLDQLTLNYKAGPSLPLLGVWFKDTQHGIAVGPFGLAIATGDGGKTWMPALELVDNPGFLHLQGIGEAAGEVFIAGERGTVFRLDRGSGTFRAVPTGYAGSLFGVAGHDEALIAYGLKGTLYRSADHGASWTRIDSPLHGLVTSAVYVPERHAFVLVTAAGEIAIADSDARRVALVKGGRPVPATGVQPVSSDELVLTGLDGVRAVELP